MDKLEFIADYLVANEVMDREQFLAVFEPNPTFEKLDAIKEAHRAKYAKENGTETPSADKNANDESGEGNA